MLKAIKRFITDIHPMVIIFIIECVIIAAIKLKFIGAILFLASCILALAIGKLLLILIMKYSD